MSVQSILWLNWQPNGWEQPFDGTELRPLTHTRALCSVCLSELSVHVHRWTGIYSSRKNGRYLRWNCTGAAALQSFLSDKLFFSLDKNFAARNELWCFTLEVFVLLLPRAFGSCWSWCPIDVSIVTCTDVRCSLAHVCLCMLRAMQIDIYIYETRISISIYCSVKVITKMSCYEVAIICFTWNLYAQNV